MNKQHIKLLITGGAGFIGFAVIRHIVNMLLGLVVSGVHNMGDIKN